MGKYSNNNGNDNDLGVEQMEQEFDTAEIEREPRDPIDFDVSDR